MEPGITILSLNLNRQKCKLWSIALRLLQNIMLCNICCRNKSCYPVNTTKYKIILPCFVLFELITRDPFYQHRLTLKRAWMSNYINYEVWDEILCLFPFHPTLYRACHYLSILGLKLTRVSKTGPRIAGRVYMIVDNWTAPGIRALNFTSAEDHGLW